MVILRKMSEIDASEITGQRQDKFEESSSDSFKLVLKLKNDRTQTKRGKNYFKIWKMLMRSKIFSEEIMMITYTSALCRFNKCNEANICLETVNRLSEEVGITANIEQRGKKFVDVITDWPDSVVDLWDSIDDHSEIERIGCMYRKKWDKETKKMIEKDTGNIIVTFKGDRVRQRIDLFGKRTSIKIRPYIAAVKQCFKCFRFGHIKAVCKSEERYIICGDLEHGKCNRMTKCRNCVGQHRSTYRACTVYEKNKNINVIMGYNNVSRKKAERILVGREMNRIQDYDRCEKPKEWPKLPSPKREIDRSDIPSTSRKVIQYKDEGNIFKQRRALPRNYRVRAASDSDRHMRDKDKNCYYRRFNNREEEVTKDKRGLAIRQGHEDKEAKQREETWESEVSEEEVDVHPQGRRESLTQKIPPGLNTNKTLLLTWLRN
ncbi:uncharacterized protein [Temnothorax nylanderi]|uniref:uncharacterized protein n=1 Tax=Temnothorax nylanderi TaxID=102681 RepID=UPI003A848944